MAIPNGGAQVERRTPIHFVIGDSDRIWPGFAHGSYWNGFDNVCVTPETRDAIVKSLEQTCRDFFVEVAKPDFPWKDVWQGSSYETSRDDWVSGIDTIEPIEAGIYKGLISLGWGYATSIVDPTCGCGHPYRDHPFGGQCLGSSDTLDPEDGIEPGLDCLCTSYGVPEGAQS